MGESARKFIASVGKMGDALIIMIDVDKILSTKEMKQITNSLAQAVGKRHGFLFRVHGSWPLATTR
jgi:hypothetical protein